MNLTYCYFCGRLPSTFEEINGSCAKCGSTIVKIRLKACKMNSSSHAEQDSNKPKITIETLRE